MVATSPPFPFPPAAFQGETREEALKNVEEAIEVYVEDVRAVGESVPVEDERTFVEVAVNR
jgi:predicted RNase H-like HicB family nuclease